MYLGRCICIDVYLYLSIDRYTPVYSHPQTVVSGVTVLLPEIEEALGSSNKKIYHRFQFARVSTRVPTPEKKRRELKEQLKAKREQEENRTEPPFIPAKLNFEKGNKKLKLRLYPNDFLYA